MGKNKKSILILRGTLNTPSDPIASVVPLSGLPLYEKRGKSLYIGDGVNSIFTGLKGTEIGLKLHTNESDSNLLDINYNTVKLPNIKINGRNILSLGAGGLNINASSSSGTEQELTILSEAVGGNNIASIALKAGANSYINILSDDVNLIGSLNINGLLTSLTSELYINSDVKVNGEIITSPKSNVTASNYNGKIVINKNEVNFYPQEGAYDNITHINFRGGSSIVRVHNGDDSSDNIFTSLGEVQSREIDLFKLDGPFIRFWGKKHNNNYNKDIGYNPTNGHIEIYGEGDLSHNTYGDINLGAILFGGADNFGSTYTPIYWKDGQPTACSFTII